MSSSFLWSNEDEPIKRCNTNANQTGNTDESRSSTVCTNSTSSAPLETATTLLEKYEKINSAIDETRRQNEQVISELFHCQQQIENLLDKRTQYEKEEQSLLSHPCEKQKMALLTSSQAKQSQENELLDQEKKHLQRLYEGLALHAQQSKNCFLTRCVEFRRDWKRARVSILLQQEQEKQRLQQETAAQPEETDLPSTLAPETPLSIFKTCLKKSLAKKTQGEVQNTVDVEMQQAKRTHDTLVSDLNSRKLHYEKQVVAKQNATETSYARLNRLTQAKNQLTRIQQDTAEIQSELVDIEQQLVNRTSTSYQSNNCKTPQVRSNSLPNSGVTSSVTPSPWPVAKTNVIQGQNQAFERSFSRPKVTSSAWNNNPYAQKKTNKTNAASYSHPYNNNSSFSSQSQQHPHKVGSKRNYNRQFGTTLQIQPTDTTNATNRAADTTAAISSSNHSSNSFENYSYRCDDIDTSHDENMTHKPTVSSIKCSLNNADEEDGEEETNQLLSYIAFGANTMHGQE